MYEDNRAGAGYYDIYAYNFMTNTEKLVCSAADSQYSPRHLGHEGRVVRLAQRLEH